MTVPVFNQRDEKYAGVMLDHSPFSLNLYGCALCSIASVLAFYGKDTNPISLNNDLTNNGGIDNQGLIHWFEIGKLYPDVEVEVISCGSEPAPLAYIDECLNNNIPIIVETRFGQNEQAMHFVTIEGKNGEYHCADPWFFDHASFNQRYGEPSRWIYSLIILKHKAGEENITIPKNTFEALVTKASLYDAFKNAGYDNYSAISSRMAEYQNELDGANSQIRSYQDFQKQIAIILNIPNQPTDIIGEVTKLVGVEDTLVEYQDKLEQQIKATNDVREQYKVIENEKVQALEAVKTAETATQARENDIEGLKKEIDTYQSDLNTCQVKLQNLVEQGVGKLTRTIKCGNYIIQIFKKK